jgi:hypothetical protein
LSSQRLLYFICSCFIYFIPPSIIITCICRKNFIGWLKYTCQSDEFMVFSWLTDNQSNLDIFIEWDNPVIHLPQISHQNKLWWEILAFVIIIVQMLLGSLYAKFTFYNNKSMHKLSFVLSCIIFLFLLNLLNSVF